MIAALVSEYRKFFTTRMWWILMICMMAYFLVISLAMAWVFAYAVSGDDGAVSQYRPMIYGLGASMGYVFPALVGAVAVTGEYRHRTIVPTYLAEPRRWVVMTAKALAAIPMGFVIAVAGTVSCLVGGAVGLHLGGADPGLWASQTWKAAGLSILALTMWSVIGVGLGMLVISQVGVIITVLAFTQLVEPLARVGLSAFPSTSGIAKFFPGAASDAVSGGTSIYSQLSVNGSMMQASSLSVGQGVLVLAAYGVVFALLGYVARIRRDVA
ncbi:MAG: ABC transporter permease [Propionibacteriaceae bacterium]|jgi:ABC-type transport system involved in multi-copper enzyme maturation permease subunit|nr:ABC transporter permease [Propionibacteriaceae bacterium]